MTTHETDMPPADDTYLLVTAANVGYAIDESDGEVLQLLGLHLHRRGVCSNLVVAANVAQASVLSEAVMAGAITTEKLGRDGFDPANPPDPDALCAYADDRIELLKLSHEHAFGLRDVNTEPRPTA